MYDILKKISQKSIRPSLENFFHNLGKSASYQKAVSKYENDLEIWFDYFIDENCYF